MVPRRWITNMSVGSNSYNIHSIALLGRFGHVHWFISFDCGWTIHYPHRDSTATSTYNSTRCSTCYTFEGDCFPKDEAFVEMMDFSSNRDIMHSLPSWDARYFLDQAHEFRSLVGSPEPSDEWDKHADYETNVCTRTVVCSRECKRCHYLWGFAS